MPLTEEELLLKKITVADAIPYDQLADTSSLEVLLDWLYTMYHLPSATDEEKEQWLKDMQRLYSLIKSRRHCPAA